ncbi:ABC transporter ATP-binding protein [Candidatus Halobeggiatoa sp. HSG11]|nr:ABC transporter ATP-binding protein [Candidatus Halobeggiatoa sp. HSG11]
MLAIEFKNVYKKYNNKQILNDINLKILEGEFFGLVGVNGAGKTTMLKSLLDLCEIEQGSINLFNVQHVNYSSRSNLAFLPEQFVPPYYLTGQKFLNFMVQLYNYQYDFKQVQTICELLDLPASVLKQPVRDYSKGMAQKLGLTACLLANKPLLVLDEPMAGLDPKARAYLKQLLLDLRAKGTTMFFSTHLLADVEALCDRMAILHEGKLQFVGTPTECCTIFSAPNLEQAYLNCIEK